MGHPPVTGRVHLTPEARQKPARSGGLAHPTILRNRGANHYRISLSAHSGYLGLSSGGQGQDDVRSGVRTTVHKRRLVIAYSAEQSTGDVTDVTVTVLAAFHTRQDWESAIREG